MKISFDRYIDKYIVSIITKYNIQIFFKKKKALQGGLNRPSGID